MIRELEGREARANIAFAITAQDMIRQYQICFSLLSNDLIDELLDNFVDFTSVEFHSFSRLAKRLNGG